MAERLGWQPGIAKRMAIMAFDAATSPMQLLVSDHHDNEPGRITIPAFWGIGDAILLTPLLRALRLQYPRSRIELVGKAHLREIFQADPHVDEINIFAPPWSNYIGKYRIWSRDYLNLIRWINGRRSEDNDWVITTRGDIREHMFALLIGGRRRFGYGRAGGRFVLTDSFPGKPPRERLLHFAEFSVEVGSLLGARLENPHPHLYLEDEERRSALEILRSDGWRGDRPILAVHLGAGAAVRRWPIVRFQQTLEKVREKIGWILILGDADSDWQQLATPSGVGVTHYSGNLRQVFALLSQTDVLFCCDSGIMHAASALDTPVAAVFGPTLPAWFKPFGKAHRVIIKEGFECRPCFDKCSFGRPAPCMEAVTVKDAVRELDILLSASVQQMKNAGV